MIELRNLFAAIPKSLPLELIETLAARGGIRIERIVSHGHVSPDGFWYDQPQREWVLLLRGEARLQIEGQSAIEMHPGDSLDIPAHARHRVEWTTPDEPTIWLAVHYEC